MKKYSKIDLENLLNEIKTATGLLEEEISTRAGYNEGYISQTKSRGKISNKLMETLSREFRDELQNAIKRKLKIAYKDLPPDERSYIKEKLLTSKEETIKAQEETIKAMSAQIETIKKGEVNLNDALKTLKDNNELLHFLVEKLIPVEQVQKVPNSVTHILIPDKKEENDKVDK